MRHAAGLLALLALATAGCGGGDAQRVLSRSAGDLRKIHSGNLTLRLIVSPREGTQGRVGFVLCGPFAFRTGSLPVAKIAYTQIAGARQATVTFISTAGKAYAEVKGKAYELPPQSTEMVRATSAQLGVGGPGGLEIGSWFKDPQVSDGGTVGGARTDHVSAGLDVVNAANGLLDLVRNLGREAPRIEGKAAQQLRDAVESSSIDVWSGKEDHLLRRLLLKASLGFSVPESLSRVLGQVVGGKVDFELAISNPNQPISVKPPVNALPASALPSG